MIMIEFLEKHSWKVELKSWQPEHVQRCESLFSLGNGKFGQRANFEEGYNVEGQSKDIHSLQGSYVAGIYYPDKTRVGWWKNGYPEYFAKVLNSVNWIGLGIYLDNTRLDLASHAPESFHWGVDMKTGILTRGFEITIDGGKRLRIDFERFCSIADERVGAIRCSIQVLSGDVTFKIKSFLDANVVNHDANWEETFWKQLSSNASDESCSVVSQTKKTEFVVAASACVSVDCVADMSSSSSAGYAEQSLEFSRREGQSVTLEKYVGLSSSLDLDSAELQSRTVGIATAAKAKGYDQLRAEHVQKWADIWSLADITIEGDSAAQQAIRFNIYHLNQTYTGTDDRLNIGPKGFTGEKYGGSTYWDTEAYCIPFYLSTRDPKVARQLLVYRYRHLPKAIENAAKLGFNKGAALYPMVTMNGEECHNEWEITFEEIHRNGAIAFAIYNYVRHTGDEAYLAEYGWDVLLGIARFWTQRSTWSEQKKAFVILGVTGPNEYENNANNNWYTNYIAAWCMRYAGEVYQKLQSSDSQALESKIEKYSFNVSELEDWKNRAEKMYYPELKGTNIKLQQDGFLDKELMNADDLPDDQRPINQHWSWDRILRSVFIKQADVLQGMYFLEHEFDLETIRENFDYYEPKTVHESSLSPCVHSILAAKLGKEEKAYEMYLRTARLDLDDYNHEVHEGLHITSMAGTWMSVVEGFGGLRVRDGQLHFDTMLPQQWKSFSFTILFRGRTLKVTVGEESAVHRLGGKSLSIVLNGQTVEL